MNKFKICRVNPIMQEAVKDTIQGGLDNMLTEEAEEKGVKKKRWSPPSLTEMVASMDEGEKQRYWALSRSTKISYFVTAGLMLTASVALLALPVPAILVAGAVPAILGKISTVGLWVGITALLSNIILKNKNEQLSHVLTRIGEAGIYTSAGIGILASTHVLAYMLICATVLGLIGGKTMNAPMSSPAAEEAMIKIGHFHTNQLSVKLAAIEGIKIGAIKSNPVRYMSIGALFVGIILKSLAEAVLPKRPNNPSDSSQKKDGRPSVD